jgi:hypothetical protein
MSKYSKQRKKVKPISTILIHRDYIQLQLLNLFTVEQLLTNNYEERIIEK